MCDEKNLPTSVSAYYKTTMEAYTFFISTAMLIASTIILWGSKHLGLYLVLVFPIWLLIMALKGFRKVLPYSERTTNKIPYIGFDKTAITLLGCPISWASVNSVEILTMPAGRAEPFKFLFIEIKGDIQSLELPAEKLKWLTQNNKLLIKKLGLDCVNFLSLCPIKYLTISVDKIDSLAEEYMSAAKHSNRIQ